MAHYVITGGAGFIGTNVVEYLLSSGHKVTVLDDLSAGDKNRLPEAVAFHECDVRDTETVIKHITGADVIVHLAAQPRVQDSIDHPLEVHAVNVDGTVSMLEAARQAGIKRIVLASTSAIYGDSEQLPLTESIAPAPKSPYALHKFVGEAYCQLWQELYGVETVALRLFNVYGPHLDPDGPYALVIGRFLKLAAANKPLTITGDGEQTRDFVHVHDVARALEAAATTDAVGAGEVINIGSGTEVSINTLAHMFSDDIEYVSPRIEPRHTYADTSKAKELLGWEPTVTLADGIAALKQEWNISK